MGILDNFASNIRTRHQLGVQRRQAEYAIQLAEMDRTRQNRDLNFGYQTTDRTYALPYVRNGLGNSGYVATADNNYRTNVQFQRADVQQQYLNQRTQALMQLSQAEQAAAVDQLLGRADLAQQLTNGNLDLILKGLGL